jgi:ankyrin repeat protein
MERVPDYQLVEAVRSGCTRDFDEAIKRGANPNAKSWDGIPSLVVAFKSERPDMARRLIEHGADAHQSGTDRRGDPLIVRAARTGDIGLISVLLDADVDPNARGQCSRTAVHHAATRGFDFVTRTLLEANANPDARDHFRETPTHFAARHGRVGVIRELLRVHADTTVQNHTAWTPAHEAVAAGHADIAKQLLDRSKDLHSHQGFARLLGGLQRVAELHDQASVCEMLNAYDPS